MLSARLANIKVSSSCSHCPGRTTHHVPEGGLQILQVEARRIEDGSDLVRFDESVHFPEALLISHPDRPHRGQTLGYFCHSDGRVPIVAMAQVSDHADDSLESHRAEGLSYRPGSSNLTKSWLARPY